jgi:Icc-related predicted phosphoesterase
MRNKLRCWGISDTHGQHQWLIVPDNIDMVIHGGDSTNYFGWVQNQPEFEDFLKWYDNLNIKYKILIAGNHDAWATKKYNREKVEECGIIYLEHEYANIEGIKIFGSPYTPTFANWHFMKDRGKLNRYWEFMDDGIDILVTHGPPKGVLDLSYNRNRVLEFCGDNALTKHVKRVKPKFHLFGHIHNNEDIINQGIRIIDSTQYMNVSCVTDGRIEKGPTSNGIIFEI